MVHRRFERAAITRTMARAISQTLYRHDELAAADGSATDSVSVIRQFPRCRITVAPEFLHSYVRKRRPMLSFIANFRSSDIGNSATFNYNHYYSLGRNCHRSWIKIEICVKGNCNDDVEMKYQYVK